MPNPPISVVVQPNVPISVQLITGGLRGPIGQAGTDGATWFTGAGVPSSGTGADGDLYLRTNGDVYRKASGSWGSVLLTLSGPQGIQGIPGTDGTDGNPGAAGAPGALWFTGAGAPSSGTGSNGDLYLRNTTGDVYQKSAGSWGSPLENLTGPQGIQGIPGTPGADGTDGTDGAPGSAGTPGTPGTNGTNGATWFTGAGVPGSGTGVNGDFYLRNTTGDIYQKAAGVWGSPIENITGPQGIQGIPGTAGSAGTPGSPGSNGTNGATWFQGSGVPSSGTGANGDFYLRTNGDVYQKAAGSWGSVLLSLVGPTGGTGPAGPNPTYTTGAPTGGVDTQLQIRTDEVIPPNSSAAVNDGLWQKEGAAWVRVGPRLYHADNHARGAIDQLTPASIGASDDLAWAIAANTIATTFARAGDAVAWVNSLNPQTTGRMSIFYGAVIPGGKTVNNIVFYRTVNPGTIAHQWAALYDVNLNLLAVSTDATNASWPTTGFAFNISGGYTPAVDKPVGVGLMLAGATMPTLIGCTITTSFPGAALSGNDATHSGLGAPGTAPNPAAALTAGGQMPYIELTS